MSDLYYSMKDAVEVHTTSTPLTFVCVLSAVISDNILDPAVDFARKVSKFVYAILANDLEGQIL